MLDFVKIFLANLASGILLLGLLALYLENRHRRHARERAERIAKMMDRLQKTAHRMDN